MSVSIKPLDPGQLVRIDREVGCSLLGNRQVVVCMASADRVTLTGRCSRAGYRSIGFGTCTATVLPAVG